jgi:hypothetical protein
MITAEQAYQKYMYSKNMSQIQRFVNSVLQEVITEEHIARKSINEKEANFMFSDIFSKIFKVGEIRGRTVYTGWKLYFEKLPAELYGKYNKEIAADLQKWFTKDAECTFICKAFEALIYELSVVRKFNISMDLRKQILTISWNLQPVQNTK